MDKYARMEAIALINTMDQRQLEELISYLRYLKDIEDSSTPVPAPRAKDHPIEK